MVVVDNDEFARLCEGGDAMDCPVVYLTGQNGWGEVSIGYAEGLRSFNWMGLYLTREKQTRINLTNTADWTNY